MAFILKLEPYDPDARDADNDGIIQEGTAWERPAGARLLLPSGLEISRGETSPSRPQLRIVGGDGKDIPYVPSWQKQQAPLQPGQSRTALADVGVRSLREMGLRDLRTSTAPPKPEPPKPAAAAKPEAPEQQNYKLLTREEFAAELERLGFTGNWVGNEITDEDLSDGFRERLDDLRDRTGMEFGVEQPVPGGPEKEFADALTDYLYGEDIWFINAGLRNGEWEDEEYERKAKLLADQIGKESPLPVPQVYRGVSDADFAMDLKPGDSFSDGGFVSTSEVPAGAQYFASQGQRSAIFVIEPTDETKDMGVFVGRKDEGEWILPPGSTFEVVDVQETGGPNEMTQSRIIRLKWTGAGATPKKEEKKTDPRLERDWEDFSDLSNGDLNDLKNYVRDLLDDARYADEDKKVADLRPKVRAMETEQKIRFNEDVAKERAQQEVTEDSAWEELFGGDQPRFGRQVSRDSFSELGGSEAAEVFAFLNEELGRAERVSEDKKWELGRDLGKWTNSDEYAKYSVLADLRNNLSYEILDKVKKDAEGVQRRVRDSQSLDSEGLDKLLTDLRDVEKLAEITANQEVAEEVRKAAKSIERRIKNGVGPAATRPASAADINKEVYGDAVPRPVDVRRPTLADPSPANGMPEPKVFGEGMSDEEAQAAIKRLRDGTGSLEDIPNEYWLEALQANSSREEFDDANSMFYEVDPSTSGAMAELSIFILRNPDGSPGNQGYVVKNQLDSSDATREIIGWGLAVAHGISPEGAAWGGNGNIIIPHVFNVAPAGEAKLGDRNYDLDVAQSPEAMPAALAHFMHNYLLSLTDRHSGNGMVVTVNGQVFVVPIDQAWGDSSSSKDMWEYQKDYFFMHPDLLTEIRDTSGMSREQQQEHYRKVQAVYDDMLKRAEQVVAGGEKDFVERALMGVPDRARVAASVNARLTFNGYKRKTQKLRQDRDRFLSDLWTPPDVDENGDEDYDYNEGEFV